MGKQDLGKQDLGKQDLGKEDMRNRHAWNVHPGAPTNLPRSNLLASLPERGEYLRWGDWSKAGAGPGNLRDRIDPSGYRHDGLADPARLKLATYRFDPSSPQGGAGIWKHHHDGFPGHEHFRGNSSLMMRQTLNLNRMNYLGSGVFSLPRK